MKIDFPLRKTYKKVIRTIWVTFFLFLAEKGSCAFYWTPDLKLAYKHLIDLEIGKADSILLANTDSNNGITPYLRHFSSCLKLAISEDYLLYENMEDKMDFFLEQVEDMDSNSPYYNYCIGEMHLHRAYLNGIFDEKIKAFWNFRTSYKAITSNQEQYPYFSTHYKTLGLLYVIIGSIPDEYEWISNSLGFRGSLEEGINFLTTCKEQQKLYKTECITYLSLVYAQLVGEPEKAEVFFEDNIPDSPFLILSKALTEIKLRNNDSAIKTLTAIKHKKKQFPILYYLEAQCYLNKLQYNKAEDLYSLYLKNYKGVHHIKASYFKLALGNYLNGENNKMQDYLHQVNTKGNAILNTDSYALKSANRPLPNPKLLKSRFLFDGGYLNQSLEYLESLTVIEKQNADVATEYFYRTAQILHIQDKKQKALEHYELCIARSDSNTELYFAPMACVKAGAILEEMGQTEKAIEFYEQVFKYKNHDYKKAIRYEAKRSLQHLKDKE